MSNNQCRAKAATTPHPPAQRACARIAARAQLSFEHAHARRALSVYMCLALCLEYAPARYLAWFGGCCQKRRHPPAPITLSCTRVSRAQSRAIPSCTALTRTYSMPAAPAPARASHVLRCLLWVRRHPPGLQHVVGARAGAARVGTGAGMVLIALCAREGAPRSGHRVPVSYREAFARSYCRRAFALLWSMGVAQL